MSTARSNLRLFSIIFVLSVMVLFRPDAKAQGQADPKVASEAKTASAPPSMTSAAPSTSVATDAPVESCECQDSVCGVCEVETGTSFYSAKCGAGGSKVKSCKKPSCEPVEDQKACLASHASQSTTAVAQKTETKTEKAADSREPAAVKPLATKGAAAGKVTDLSGTVRLMHAQGASETPRKGLVVFEGDVVETKADGRLMIELTDGSQMVLPPASRVRIEKVAADAGHQNRKVLLNLLMGKVRNHAAEGYSGENVFRVHTRTAVAGVRGTEFVTSFEPGEKEWVTTVQTIKGHVQLGGETSGGAPGESGKLVDVLAGTYASFVVEAPPQGADSTEIDSAAKAGYLSPVFKMKDEELKILIDATSMKVGAVDTTAVRSAASVASADGDQLCTEPAGQFNQCSFTCEGNPKGEKTCRTDLPNVRCERRLCRANGHWADPQRMPSSQADLCKPGQAVVQACGAY